MEINPAIAMALIFFIGTLYYKSFENKGILSIDKYFIFVYSTNKYAIMFFPENNLKVSAESAKNFEMVSDMIRIDVI
jgi:hypothetical protein